MRKGRRVAVLLAAAIVAAGCTTAPSAPSSVDDRTHVVVDTDLGPDDVMALLYLLRRDDVTIDAVTLTGDGLAHCDPGVRNARALLAFGGSPDTPVACGPETPLTGDHAFPEEWRSFADDLRRLNLPSISPATGNVADAPALLRASLTGGVRLLTLGPFTNVAAALRAEPGLADRIPSVTSMAGAVTVAGNAPGNLAEYNVWIDPVAAKETLSALSVTLVPLDATNHVPATPFFLDALAAHLDTPEARVVHALLWDNSQIAAGTYYFWDPLAAVLLLAPSLGTYADARVMLDTSDTATAGRMSASDEGVPVRDTVDADALAFEREYLSVLTGDKITRVRPDPDLTLTFDGRRCAARGSTRIAPGGFVVAFRNHSNAGAAAAVARLRGVTYEQLVSALGPPGARITETPEGVGVVGATPSVPPGDHAMIEVALTRGTGISVCVIQEQHTVAVWMGPKLLVG